MTSLAQRLGISRFDADQHYRAGLAAFAARDQRAAINEVQAAIELLPNHAEYHAALGLLLLEDKQKPAAVAAFDEALRLNPYEALANYGKGMIAYRAKDWRAAEGHFLNALAAQPERAEAQYYIGMVQHRLGQNAEALEWMRSAAAAFAADNDRRESHCTAWMREFEKLAAG